MVNLVIASVRRRRRRSRLVVCGVAVLWISACGGRHDGVITARSDTSLAPAASAPNAASSPELASAASGSVGSATTGTSANDSSRASETQTTEPPPTVTTETATPLSPPPGTGVYGYVAAGPTCPVERADQPCPPRPVSAHVVATDSSGRTIGSTDSDANGAYRLDLAAGSYTISASTGNAFPRCPAVQVEVTDGNRTRADINCDTGIR